MSAIQNTNMSINATTAVGALCRHPSCRSTFLSHTVFPTAKPLGHKRVDRCSLRVDAGNANSSGLFAPLVIVTRDIVGKKQFNKFRGKAIQLHSQVIGEFCKEFGIGADIKKKLIGLAKDNGGKLGFLA